jgi:hypothetical protein
MTYIKSIFTAGLLWVSLAAVAQGAGESRGVDPSRDAAFRFADSVFGRPGFVFETVEPDIPAEMQPILARMYNAISANSEWFAEYRKKYAGSGAPLPYDEHFGITPEQYRKVQHMELQPPQMAVADSQKVSVSKDQGIIQFKSEGSVHVLDFLFIDLQHRLLMYGGDTIPYRGRVDDDHTNPYGPWRGYVWRLERTDVNATLAAGKPTARVIEVDLGLPQKPGKAYIRIEYQDMNAGVTTSNLELVGYVR